MGHARHWLAIAVLLAVQGMIGTNLLAQNPVPFIDPPLAPTSVSPGGPAFTLTINGAGFVTGATVNWNGTPLATTLVSAARLTAAVPAAIIAGEGTASITVNNPAPGGGTSNVQNLSVANSVASSIFTAIPVYGTGTAACGIAVADFNQDGVMDIAFCSGSGISIELGVGDGTFQSPFNAGAYPIPGATPNFWASPSATLTMTEAGI